MFSDTVKIRFREEDAYVFNVEHNTEPAVIHGNGLSKVQTDEQN